LIKLHFDETSRPLFSVFGTQQILLDTLPDARLDRYWCPHGTAICVADDHAIAVEAQHHVLAFAVAIFCARFESSWSGVSVYLLTRSIFQAA
jgi:hypothetical protein